MKTLAIAALALMPALVSASDLVMVAESDSSRFFTNPKHATSKGNNVTFTVTEFPGNESTTVTVDCSSEFQGRLYINNETLMWRHDGNRVYDSIALWGCIALLPISRGGN